MRVNRNRQGGSAGGGVHYFMLVFSIICVGGSPPPPHTQYPGVRALGELKPPFFVLRKGLEMIHP